MLIKHGHPIRSDDLRRGFAEAEGALREAEARTAALEDRLEMTRLALWAVRPHAPKARVYGGASAQRRHTLYLPALPLTETELLGSSVATRRTAVRDVVLSHSGTGELTLLRPWQVWAREAPERTALFEARLDPAYLMYYNELVVPHVSGTTRLYLHHSRGHYEYVVAGATRVFRFGERREFNGHLTIESTSEAGTGTGYIHALGGLTLSDAAWLEKGVVVGEGTVGFEGDVRVASVRAYPHGRPLAYRAFVGGEELIGAHAWRRAEPDTPLRVEAELPWETAVSFLEVELAT